MALAATKQEEIPFQDDELPEEAWAKITTLKGDIRDAILKWFKAKEQAWGQMSEFSQKVTINEVETFAAKIVHEAVRLVATRGFDSIPVTISKAGLDVEKGIVATVSIARTKENVVDINECLGMAIQLVPLGLADFMGEKAPAKPDVIGDLRIPEGATGAAAGATGATGAPADEPHDPETGELPPVPATGAPPEHQAPLEGGAKAEGT